MTMPPCIITCAVTGSLPQKADNPGVPITPSEQRRLAPVTASARSLPSFASFTAEM